MIRLRQLLNVCPPVYNPLALSFSFSDLTLYFMYRRSARKKRVSSIEREENWQLWNGRLTILALNIVFMSLDEVLLVIELQYVGEDYEKLLDDLIVDVLERESREGDACQRRFRSRFTPREGRLTFPNCLISSQFAATGAGLCAACHSSNSGMN